MIGQTTSEERNLQVKSRTLVTVNLIVTVCTEQFALVRLSHNIIPSTLEIATIDSKLFIFWIYMMESERAHTLIISALLTRATKFFYQFSFSSKSLSFNLARCTGVLSMTTPVRRIVFVILTTMVTRKRLSHME